MTILILLFINIDKTKNEMTRESKINQDTIISMPTRE